MTFNKLSAAKKVIVYAEALDLEYYELLGHIKDCILSNEQEEFVKCVGVWQNKKKTLQKS